MAEDDPNSLAKWVYRRYAEGFGQQAEKPTNRIVLEGTKRTSKPTVGARSGEPWTEQERMHLVRHSLQGETFSALVLKHQRSESSLRAELKRIGQSLQAIATT